MDAEILEDNLTQGANLGAGFAKWSPDTGETMRDRLGAIVGGAMGYEPEDLPWEVPLIELGLDSLMAVRIKNRVEYDFDLPPIQLTAVRDANLYAVEKLIEYAIEHRDEVEQLHEHQKTQTPRRSLPSRPRWWRAPLPYGRPSEPEAQAPVDIPPPPTDPAGPDQPSAASLAALGPRAAAQGSADAGGSHRGAGRRRAAARSGGACHVRDVGHRHRQVAWRHLQPAARTRRRDRREDGATAFGTRRGPDHRRATSRVRRPSRRWRPSCANTSRLVRSTGSSAPCARAKPEVPTGPPCSCSTPRAVRRWCTSRCSSGCRRTPRCTASSGSRAPSRSAPLSTCRSCWRWAATDRSSWPAGRWAACWPTRARSV